MLGSSYTLGFVLSLQDLYTRVKGIGRRSRRIVNYRESQKSLEQAEEPISTRLRLNAKKTKSKSPRKRVVGIDDYRRKMLKRRRRERMQRSAGNCSDSSSTSTTDSDCSQRNKRSKKDSRYEELILGKNGGSKTGHSGDLQPLAIDSSINFSSIGGLGQQIDKLKEMVIFPILYKEFFKKRNVTPPRGLLFHGPPGTGKTLLARALATEASTIGGREVSFFLRKGADILNKWIGESERQLKLLFEQAALKQPSIIFFDEIDGLAPVRSSKTDQIHNSIVSTLLAEMDGLKDRGDVIVIGATNRIDSLDPALRRPGRFDHEFPFFLPSFEARQDILRVNIADEVSDELVSELALLSVGYSGADIKLLCSEANMGALRRRYPQIYGTSEKLVLNYESIKVERKDWEKALQIVVRSSDRSIFSSTFSPMPLPLALQPLFADAVSAISIKLEKIFPYKLPVVKQPSPKTFWLHTDCAAANEHVIPAVLHGMDSQIPIFILSVQLLALKDSCGASIAHLFAETTRRTSPSVLYIPSLDEVYNYLTPEGRIVLRSELGKVVCCPVLVIASVRQCMPEDLSTFFELEGVGLPKPSSRKRQEFFKPTFRLALEVRVPAEASIEEKLPVALPEVRKMSAEEISRIEKTETRILRELRIFLREIIFKLARNKKFTEFTKPVDTEEVPDYLEIVERPMDLETMMVKVNQGIYHSAHQFLEDIDLIVNNALNYNPAKTDSDRRLRHRACELRDFAYTFIDVEMESDFEDTCQKIIRAREDRKREAGVSLPKKEKSSLIAAAELSPAPTSTAENTRTLTSATRKRRSKSSWYKGVVKKAARKSSQDKMEVEELADSEDLPLIPPTPEALPPKQQQSGSGSTSKAERKKYKDDLSQLCDQAVEISADYTTRKLLELRFQLLRVVEENFENPDKTQLIGTMKHLLIKSQLESQESS